MLLPSPTPYGANTSVVVAETDAGSDIVICVALSTLWTMALAGMPVPLTGIPGDMGVLPPLVVSLKPVMTGDPLVVTPFCWMVMALNNGASVTRFLFEPSQ